MIFLSRNTFSTFKILKICTKVLYQFSFPNYHSVSEETTVIAADIGGTKTHLALFQLKNEKLILLRDERFASQDFPSFSAIVEEFERKDHSPSSICIGFAGPVMDNFAQATNLSWNIDGELLRNRFKHSKCLYHQ